MPISRKNMIIIGCIIAVIVASCGYSIIVRNSSGQVVIKNSSPETNTAGEADSADKIPGEEVKKEITVHIIGRVKNPGLVKVQDGARISDAIAAAGGALRDADLESVNLAYKLQDGKQVYIPSKSEMADNKPIANSSSAGKKAVPQAVPKKIPGVQPDTKPPSKITNDSAGIIEEKTTQGETAGKGNTIVNINTADAKELENLPGVGPSTAQKIIDYRNKSGLFKVPEDIMKVNGIGNQKYEKMKDKIVV